MKVLVPVFFTLLLCLAPAFAQAPAVDTTDNQVWNETQIILPLVRKNEGTEKLSFFVNGNLRFGRDVRHLIDERVGFGFIYKHNKYISITPSYIYIAQQPAPGQKLYESRLRFAVGLENHWKKFSVDDRNLVEYRFRHRLADSVRYRNKLRFLVPVKRNDKEIFAPYVADEVFYDFRAKGFTRNEISFGMIRKLTPKVSADLFYTRQIDLSVAARNVNIFGINLKIKID